jgi:stage II sporulation protein P
MTAVARAFCETLRSFGIGAVHVTSPCDLQGSNRAYINARNEITKIIAENPSIKYVIDVERATDTNGASELLRTSVSLGNKSYAPIRLTVSGGGSLEYMRICQNLSFALRLNGLVAEQSASLTRPVQIADAVYTDGNSPRNLKIEIGSYTSTLDEAVSSAELLAELFSLLLGS